MRMSQEMRTAVFPGQDSDWHLKNVEKGAGDGKDPTEPRKV